MVSPDPPDEEAFGPLSYVKLAASTRTRRRGLFRRAALFASGVKASLLYYVPSEENTYSVLGTCVIFTSVIASVASGVAAGYLMRGKAFIGVVPIFVGVLFGALIFVLDRVLVKAVLNPYTFPPEVLHALWNPTSDARWYDVLSGKLARSQPTRRSREVAATFLKASPRFLIALATSFVFAEIALFMIFSGEINTRAQLIQQVQQRQHINQLDQTYAEARKQLEDAINAQVGSGDPVAAQISSQLKILNGRFPNLNSDTQKLGQAQAAELDGTKLTLTLSNGQRIRTTGKAGAAGAYKDLLREYRTYSSRLRQLNGQIAADKAALARRQKHLRRTNASSIDHLHNEEIALDKQHAADLQAATSGTGTIKGIMIREQALNQLADDMDPNSVVPTPPPACARGVLGAWCHMVRLFIMPTPLGPFIAAFRLFFISVELLPILMKLVMSLRRRRPYDALLAAIEEVSVASSIELLDNQLVQVGAILESRASWRKSQRSGTGAEFILASAVAGLEDHGDPTNALASALTRRFKSRSRLWPRRREKQRADSHSGVTMNGRSASSDMSGSRPWDNM